MRDSTEFVSVRNSFHPNLENWNKIDVDTQRSAGDVCGNCGHVLLGPLVKQWKLEVYKKAKTQIDGHSLRPRRRVFLYYLSFGGFD